MRILAILEGGFRNRKNPKHSIRNFKIESFRNPKSTFRNRKSNLFSILLPKIAKKSAFKPTFV
ncbi:MAG: hypothetical protein RIS64_3179 [Bacteroidota bacterium]|jgi:hypothetical protein